MHFRTKMFFIRIHFFHNIKKQLFLSSLISWKCFGLLFKFDNITLEFFSSFKLSFLILINVCKEMTSVFLGTKKGNQKTLNLKNLTF